MNYKNILYCNTYSNNCFHEIIATIKYFRQIECINRVEKTRNMANLYKIVAPLIII